MSERTVQFNKADNPDGSTWYPDNINLFSDTKDHPQDNTKTIAEYAGSDESIVDFDGYFPSSKILQYSDFMRLFGVTVYAQIKLEYNINTDANLIYFFDLAKENKTVELASQETSQGCDILIANVNIDFTSDDKEKILQNIAL